jgi:hypothetical protein
MSEAPIYPMNAAPGVGGVNTPYVDVVIQNGICALVSNTLDSAVVKRTKIMNQSLGCGPWNPVMDTPEGFLYTGPSGASIMCSRVPLMP